MNVPRLSWNISAISRPISNCVCVCACLSNTLCVRFNSSPETSFEGYPFHVTMRVTYCLKESSFNISVHAEVTGDTLSAPFAVGWHPYITFNDTTVNRSRLSIPPNIQLIFNDNMIPVGSEVSNGSLAGLYFVCTCFRALCLDP
jgi:galactose mutarotase-like enzyme